MSALKDQIAGDHYKKMKIQPLEYCHANNIGKIEGDVIAYVSRWRDKNGIEDLLKARHEIDILIELELRANQMIDDLQFGKSEPGEAMNVSELTYADYLDAQQQNDGVEIDRFDEERMDRIGQNGPDGLVYEQCECIETMSIGHYALSPSEHLAHENETETNKVTWC